MKNILITLVFFFALIFDVSSQVYNNFYGGIVNDCNYDTLNTHLVNFENLGVKEAGTPALNNTLTWLINEYQSYGYTDIVIDTFTYNGHEVYNLIVTKTGTHYPNEFYVLDGHYDTKVGTGTNDNGSGTSIILETARLMQNVSTKYSIKFIHFSMEEVGLAGSYHYVNNIAFPSGMNIKVLLNIDEVGGIAGMENNTIVCERDGNTPTTENAASWAYTDTLAACVELYSSLFTTISYAYASDYMPFKAKGYVITGLFEDNYSPHAHTPTDSIGNMDIPYVFEIAKATIGASLYFAEAYETTSIEELSQHHLTIYPNPTKNKLIISYNNTTITPTNYTFINYLGEHVKEGTLISNETIIDVSELTSGVYFLSLNNNKTHISRKVIIQ